MPNIEFIYDPDCPNVTAARAALAQALRDARLPPTWCEWNRDDPQSPAYARAYGSPTLLIDGRDVAGFTPAGEATSCRIYTDATGAVRGVPPVKLIRAALANGTATGQTGPARAHGNTPLLSGIAAVPAIGTALLQSLSCPACWPAYAAALGALGFGFMDYTPYLLPAMVIFVVLALIVLARAARGERRYGPLVLGVLAGILLIGAKLIELDAMFTYIGAALFAGASIWTAVARRGTPACATCGNETSTT